jgi:hypothetical protein
MKLLHIWTVLTSIHLAQTATNPFVLFLAMDVQHSVDRQKQIWEKSDVKHRVTFLLKNSYIG